MARDKNPDGNIRVRMVITPLITPKFIPTPNFTVTKCDDFQPACTMKQNTGVIKQAVLHEKEAVLY